MTEFRAAEEHGAFSEPFPGVFIVTGGFHFGPGLGITRNMIVVKEGDDLTVVSSMRLSPAGEAELDALGKVKHVIRIGGFHGADDPYYVDRYKAQLWVPPRVKDAPEGARTLTPDEKPISCASVFLFEKGKMGEAALLLEREGGVLVTADCYQNWTSFEGCTFLAKPMMRMMGFGPTVIGGPWVKAQGPAITEDFSRLRGIAFKHLIPGHGTPLLDDAKAGLERAIAKRFGAVS
jgi:hypothetical protein